FWLKVSDDDASKLLRVFTLLSQLEIEALEKTHAEAPHLRTMQKALAKEVTIRVHSLEDYETAVKASEILFGKGTIDTLKSINEATFLAIFAGVPQTEISRTDWETSKDIVELLSTLTQGQVYASKGEVRRAITGGAVSINKAKIETAEQTVDFDLLQNRYLLVQKGKKNHLIKVVD
ncbi:MAG: tyrosine--tRNA ligase, partial [Bacteroidota bacterium]